MGDKSDAIYKLPEKILWSTNEIIISLDIEDWVNKTISSFCTQSIPYKWMYIYGLHVLDGPLLQVSVGCTSLKIWTF